MGAFILAVISAYGWIIMATAFCGAALDMLSSSDRLNRILNGKIYCALAILPLFFWELLKKPRDLFHLFWLMATAPFAITIGLFLGFCDLLWRPFRALKQ